MRKSIIGVTLLTADEVLQYSSKIEKKFYSCWATCSHGRDIHSACIVCPDGKIDRKHFVDYTPIKIYPVLKLQMPNKELENFKINYYNFLSIAPDLAICDQDIATIPYSRFVCLLEKGQLQGELDKWYEKMIKPFLESSN